ncbi:hypothetical protein CCM_09586 [Cordyceps militaris CM01]|uniref:Uncharacterized protein n=1 Tax=Cordyceps militaris (strain CM01) TaxID=983644 RepID=G3JUU5_CORMM|nr:uncharacterized protein CCM_09586 [Cordyceps militaris CM01]EGX87625.1 hypothetical protein CCM_09586 [Cordyceps militaris CM01]
MLSSPAHQRKTPVALSFMRMKIKAQYRSTPPLPHGAAPQGYEPIAAKVCIAKSMGKTGQRQKVSYPNWSFFFPPVPCQEKKKKKRRRNAAQEMADQPRLTMRQAKTGRPLARQPPSSGAYSPRLSAGASWMVWRKGRLGCRASRETSYRYQIDSSSSLAHMCSRVFPQSPQHMS